jgi:hypothetical protein
MNKKTKKIENQRYWIEHATIEFYMFQLKFIIDWEIQL